MTGNTNGVFRNNPGNIRLALDPSARWQGFSGTPGGIADVDTMANGVRALAKQLLVYQTRYKLGSVGEIIARWAPPSENDTKTYTAYVCERCEVKSNDPLDLRDFSTIYWLTVAIGEFENGREVFHEHVSEEDLQAGVREALA